MDDEVELTVRKALIDALDVVPADGAVPSPALVLAASLHRLAVDLGLAQREDPDFGVVRSVGLPAPAARLLDACFGTGGAPAADDDVRNGLHDALVALSAVPGTRRAVNRTRALSGDEFLEFAQIYWNLDAQDPRGKLPLRRGRMPSREMDAFMKVPGADVDYAELTLKERADRTPGYARAAGAFYDRAARVAALVAKHVLEDGTAPVGAATLRSTTTLRGSEWAIVWPGVDPPARIPGVVREVRDPATADPTIGTLQELRHASLSDGELGQAAILSTTLIAILRERSERDPGDHESPLAGEYLQAGLTFAVAGRFDDALDHLANAARAIRTLSEMSPDIPAHRMRLAIARTMQGTLLAQVGRPEDADDVLADAVALSQALTDEDARNEDLLAVSLSMRGAFLIQLDRATDASTVLVRAVAIAQKLAAAQPDDDTLRLQLANTLATYGMLQLHVNALPQAEQALSRSLAIARSLTASGFEERMIALLVASDRFLLGAVHLSADREEAADESLTAAVELARGLADQRADESTLLLVAGAQYMRGMLYGMSDRGEEAAESFREVVAICRSVMADTAGGAGDPPHLARAATFLGASLFALGLGHLDDGRDADAEASLVEAVEVLRRRPADAVDPSMLPHALDRLIELHERSGRLDDVARTLALRRTLDDQTPDAPAAV